MTTSESACLFHHRQYSSNIQRIVNLLRVHAIKIKCDLNLIAKQWLCTCTSNVKSLQITVQQLVEKHGEFAQLKSLHWFDEVNRIVQMDISKRCDSKIALYKLLAFICEICTGEKYSKSAENVEKEEKVQPIKPNLIRCCIELTLPPSHIGHLIGRDGHFHKQITKETSTRIHFDNAPYSIKVSSKRRPEFDLDLFQSSSSSIKATITGDTTEAVENAVKALKEHDQNVQSGKQYFESCE